MLIYPADERFWFQNSRRIRFARPDANGQFAFSRLPPGQYWLAVLDDVDPALWSDRTFLTKLRATARRVVLGDGEQRVENLQR